MVNWNELKLEFSGCLADSDYKLTCEVKEWKWTITTAVGIAVAFYGWYSGFWIKYLPGFDHFNISQYKGAIFVGILLFCEILPYFVPMCFYYVCVCLTKILTDPAVMIVSLKCLHQYKEALHWCVACSHSYNWDAQKTSMSLSIFSINKAFGRKYVLGL